MIYYSASGNWTWKSTVSGTGRSSRGQTMRREHVRLAITILLALALTMTFTPTHTEAAWERLELVPSIYTGNNTYVPGETIEMVLHASPGELYNVTITSPGSEAPVDNNVQIGESSTASVLHKVGDTTPDGQYTFRVWDGSNLTAWQNFSVQAYKFNIETDRDSYLVGDEMKIFWTANKLRDQTLPPDGFASISIWNETTDVNNQTTRTVLYRTTDVSPAGSTSFTIPAPVDKDAKYYVGGWFNDTQAFAKRHQYAQTSFTIKHLGVLVNLNKPQYSLGSLMFIDIKTVVTNTSSPMITDTGEPGCSIEIAIYEENDFSESKIPGGILTTDSHGNLQYIIQLNSPTFSIDVNKYIVEVSAYKWDKAFNSIIVTRDFTVS
ncbi:MAG: hypothetical protein KAS67_01415, partial [Thermoplasmata archaeon]|nr:hypothetical protein [Thermoplasmata archaeon]